ncbi:MAG: hypothetical protein LBF84_00470 [Holosporales bacterium]|jgi:hypothetical protein|nr:hypothetical protein [Holosporales bacterium]
MLAGALALAISLCFGTFCRAVQAVQVACQNCTLAAEQLHSVATNAKQYYTSFSNYATIAEIIKADGASNKIDEIIACHDAIIAAVEDLCCIFDKYTFFTLTPRRACKLPIMYSGKSIYSCLNAIDTAICSILSLINYEEETALSPLPPLPPLPPPPDYSSCSIFELVNSIRPYESWKNDVRDLCYAITAENTGDVNNTDNIDEQNLHKNKIKFFMLQYYFYESLCLCFSIMSNIFTKLEGIGAGEAPLASVCLTGTWRNALQAESLPCEEQKSNALLSQIFASLSQDFYFEGNLFWEMIKQSEENKTKKNEEEIQVIVDSHKEIPLKTQSGKLVGFIPGDQDYNVFVLEATGQFSFPTQKPLWTPQNMAYIMVDASVPVEIDHLTGVITSPQQFFGKQAPVVSYITYEDLYKGITKNTDKSASIIKKIYKQLRKY